MWLVLLTLALVFAYSRVRYFDGHEHILVLYGADTAGDFTQVASFFQVTGLQLLFINAFLET